MSSIKDSYEFNISKIYIVNMSSIQEHRQNPTIMEIK